MKTEALIDLLARGAGPAPRALVARRLSPAVLVGLLFSVLCALGLWGLVPSAMLATTAPWLKLAYAGCLAMAAWWWTARLSRPAAPCAWPRRTTLAVLLAMLMLGLDTLLAAPAGERMLVLLGSSWIVCPGVVLALSLPALAAAMWALRGLAPTQPRRAGFAAGVLAGSLGAFGYALSCTEVSATFVAVWYSLGIALTGALGATLGPRLLRW